MNRDCLACQAPLHHLLETDPTLAPLWQSLARLRFAAGETVLPMGAAAASVWWVEHGVVRLYFVAADGRERNRSFHAEGTWVSGGIPPEPGVSLSASPYAIEALEPLSLVALPYATLSQWRRDLPVVEVAIADGLRAVFARQAAREAELLLLNATQRYQLFLRDHGPLAERLPLHHVASYLGVTNVALSRIRGRLRAASTTSNEDPRQ